MIKNEKCIISDKTLNLLTSILGKSNLGIASGSKLKPAEYVLKDRLDHFNPRALIFADRVEKAEREQLDKGIKTSLRKPNPFSLLESVKALKPAKCPLYVGDSMEDIMTVEEAKSTHPNFLFAGVYRFSSVDDALLDSLLKYGCDIVVPSVNELPFALEAAGGKQK